VKSITARRPSKKEREKKVLLGLVDLYIRSGKPVGSNTLRENGFEDLSSATIRNYFARLEEDGYLLQQHSSGGRAPTAKAYNLYAESVSLPTSRELDLTMNSPKEVTEFLHSAAESLSADANLPVFLTTPIFEMDFIQNLRLIRLDESRILSVIITDFGLIRTESLYLPDDFREKDLSRIQDYFYWRLNKGEKPNIKDEKLLKWAQRLYNELMVRHLVESANTQTQNLFKTGLSKLLDYPEYASATDLAGGLSIFENPDQMIKILKCCLKKNTLTHLIGPELTEFAPHISESSTIMVPYYINQVKAGAIAILGPMRIPYDELFSLIKQYSETITNALTEQVHKYKIAFKTIDDAPNNLDLKSSILLEDRSK